MSTDFENAVIVFGQSLKANWETPDERDLAKRRLVELIDAEFDGTCFGLAMKCIVAQAADTVARRVKARAELMGIDPAKVEVVGV